MSVKNYDKLFEYDSNVLPYSQNFRFVSYRVAFPQTIRDWNALPDSLISSAKVPRMELPNSFLW